MRSKLFTLLASVALTTTLALPTEQGKENFFQYLTSLEEGRTFLS